MINKGQSIIALRDADLSKANLSNINLKEADLREANLSGADVSAVGKSLDIPGVTSLLWIGADLSGTNLRGAMVALEQLDEAKSLKGATLPDGSKHS